MKIALFLAVFEKTKQKLQQNKLFKIRRLHIKLKRS